MKLDEFGREFHNLAVHANTGRQFRIRKRKIKAAAKTIFVECRIKTFCAVLLSVARRFIWAKKGATLIYKSGEVTDTGNHRPIATLESFSKVLELYLF